MIPQIACWLILTTSVVGKLMPPRGSRAFLHQNEQRRSISLGLETLHQRGTSPPHRYLNSKTAKFAVNGTGIPDVDFDVGESYAGLIPISNATDSKKYYFWFFPTAEEDHKEDKEIIIWLTGGPGCSSLMAFLGENGPFLWQDGTSAPIANPFSWHLLTNVIWVDQPGGVGFSDGPVTVTNDDELSVDFLGFWKNFVDTFGLHGYKVYIAVESAAGVFGPYIASHMLDAKDTTHYDVGGLLVYDGIISDTSEMLQRNVALADYVAEYSDIISLDDPTMEWISNKSESCGFTQWHHRYLTYPPRETAPVAPPGTKAFPNGTIVVADEDCYDFFFDIADKRVFANACASNYNILVHCPYTDTEIYTSEPYFNRDDVKKAINAPNITYSICADFGYATPNGTDFSLSPDHKQLPQVIEATQNVILAHGGLDYILPLNGVLLAIQNMTWGGKQGFQSAPSAPFYVPHYDDGSETQYGANAPASSGVLGTTHTERGLTLVVTRLAGHMGPADSAAGSWRHVEKLLGRVDSLSEIGTFTTRQLRNVTQEKGPLGRGTVKIPTFGKN